MNIYDIAQQAGVSIATVSRVINNKDSVSAATRAKVEAVLEQSGYTPSAIARGMVSKSMRAVAVLVVDIRVAHYAQQAYVIEQEFSRRGFDVILGNTGGTVEATVRYLKTAAEKQVDGIILVGSVFNRIAREPEVEALLHACPVVMANGRLDLPNSCGVQLDDQGGAAQAAEHLVAMGKRDLWFVLDQDTNSAIAKRDGFLFACEKLGVRGRVIETEFGVEGGRKAAKELVRSCRLFDGIVCGEDATAVGVVKGIANAGLRIPQDVAITGYNNSVYARLCEPKLTTVDNKLEQVALNCVKLLQQMMDGAEKPEPVLILPEMVQGWTT